MSGQSDPGAEILVPDAHDKDYQDYRKGTDLREPYRLPPEALKNVSDTKAYDVAESPLIAFVNTGSGGRVGNSLMAALSRSLGSAQVFNPIKNPPEKVLQAIWSNLDAMEAAGDSRAAELRSRFKIAACGGDGTVAWVLGAVKAAGIDPEPAVSIMPLGTGNDLSRTFKWGKKFKQQWIKNNDEMYKHLKEMADGEYCELDTWKIKVTVPDAKMLDRKKRPPGFKQDGRDDKSMVALSWNYVSVGIDAESAYRFHHLRNTKPCLASSRILNQMWYAVCGLRSGWMCCPQAVNNKVSVKILTIDNKWEDLVLPNSVRALVLVNLQSYAGGRNIFGKKLAKKDKERKMQKPEFNDGILEIVGLKAMIHTGFVLTGLAHGVRLAQCRGARLEVKAPGSADSEPGISYMQLDGEPWPQSIPSGKSEQPLVMEITLSGKSIVLMNTEGKKPPGSQSTLPVQDSPAPEVLGDTGAPQNAQNENGEVK